MQRILDAQLMHYKINALYISNPVNIEYLTGFSGSFGVAIVIPGQTILVTDQRYIEEAREHCHGTLVLDILDPEWENIIHSSKTIGFEAKNMTVHRFERLQKKFHTNNWIPCFPIIEEMRKTKNAFEITAIQKACQIADKALEQVLKTIQEGNTEIEIAWKLEKAARDSGAEGLSFPAIVAFEKNSAVPHHESGHTRLKKGDTVLIDFGVTYHGYCSDMTRTYFFKNISPEKERVYNIVLEAQKIGMDKIKIHKPYHEAFNEVMSFFEDEDLGSFFTHSLGHGVGLDVHESPNISHRSKDAFQEWQTVTCEPGLYFPQKFGVRIEDLGVIQKEGFKILTSAPKDLRILL